MSSDEEDGQDQNHSLEGFVVDNTHCSQGLNGTPWIYLKKLDFFFYPSEVYFKCNQPSV